MEPEEFDELEQNVELENVENYDPPEIEQEIPTIELENVALERENEQPEIPEIPEAEVVLKIEIAEPDNAEAIDETEAAIDEEEDDDAIGQTRMLRSISTTTSTQNTDPEISNTISGHVNPGIMGTYTPLLTEILMPLSNPSP